MTVMRRSTSNSSQPVILSQMETLIYVDVHFHSQYQYSIIMSDYTHKFLMGRPKE